MNYSLRMKRLLVGSAAGAMVLATVPTGIAAAGVDEVCEGAEDNDFDDVADTNSHKENIDCLASYEITVGDSAGDYNPGDVVTRGQMATFIARFITQAENGNTDVPDDAADAFDDDDGSTHEDAINYLASIDVVSGTSSTTFEPSAEVSRGQMARFIVQALEHLGATLPENAPDEFDDDDGTTHEEMINILAELQVVSGFGDGTYRPGEGVSRQQMATFIIGGAGVADDEGQWNGVMNPSAPVESNQDFDVTPSEAAENTVSAASPNQNRGARQYSVSGLDDATTYDIQLYPAGNVSTDSNGVVSFTDDNESSGSGDNEADLDTVNAVVEVVNGSDVADSRNVEASPVNGTITFTIDSTTADSVVPVVFVDTENDGTLELNSDNEPTEDFGIGGQKTWVPAEASQGNVTADETISSVNKTTDRIVTNVATYFYDANDTFYVGTGEAPCDTATNQVTLAGFEQELGASDQLDGGDGTLKTFYQPEPELSSRFCLEDVAPTAPTITGADEITDSAMELTLTGVTSGATVTVYCEQADAGAITTSDAVCATATSDSDSGEANYQVQVTGLNASTSYDFRATQTVDGEQSGLSNELTNQTTAAAGSAARPVITDARLVTDAGLQGIIDTGDVWTLTFDQDMDDDVESNGAIVVQDSDGDRYQINCEDTPANADDNVVSADCVLEDSGSNADRVLRIVIQEADVAGEDLSGTATGNNVAEYPVTITNADSDVEDEQGDVVDLANSTDLVIDNE